MHILGISCHYHDAAACLVKDGKVIAAAEEERFTRKKHDHQFPENAIKYCLKHGGITGKELDYVGFYEKPVLKFSRMLETHIDTFPRSIEQFTRAVPAWLTEKLRIKSIIHEKTGYKGEIFFIKHHLSHAASAFLPSPFSESAIITWDAVGEWTTTAYGTGKGNKVKMTKELQFPNSIGMLYSTVTAFLGFKVNSDEYKVMGLASYGTPKYYDKLKKLVVQLEDGSIKLDTEYFAYEYSFRMYSSKFVREFGKPRKPETEITQYHIDLAASLQKLTEDMMVNIAKHVRKETGQKKLCMAGGVALNVVANKRILDESGFERIYVQPASSDAGGALGIAMYIYNSMLDNPRNYVMTNAYLGPEYSDDEIKRYLDSNSIKYEEYEKEEDLLRETARLIHENRIIGWFQGRMEYGPRALGARSIIANPCNPEMKDILNSKVKHREDFRPFAPVTTEEDAKKYFKVKQPDPFMVLLVDVKKDKMKLIPSVTHVDGTGRLQTTTEKDNPRYYRLIKTFKNLSKVPVLINTSFNIRGEPIVCSPNDAYRCFKGTGIDVLVMGRFIIKK
ncbi:carbamoyltransferase [Candidatus Woesearchaeota archaeon]|nr:carbamoyltransferase [Candidatus Woesearchaeota archaeon]